MLQSQNLKNVEDAEAYEPCCDWIMYPASKALRAKTVAGARRVSPNRNSSIGSKYTHKHFFFIPDKEGRAAATYAQQEKKETSKNKMQSDNLPGEETEAAASTFPDLKGPAELNSTGPFKSGNGKMPTQRQMHLTALSNIAREAIRIIDQITRLHQRRRVGQKQWPQMIPVNGQRPGTQSLLGIQINR